MIVATKTVDALLKGVISPDKLMISRIDSVCKSIQLDPNISTPKKEMFVVSNDDIKNPTLRKEFEEAVRSKHPQSLIMYINKNGREIPGIESGMFDSYLVKPKREDVKTKFYELVRESESKAKFKVSDTIDIPEEFKLVEESPTVIKKVESVEEESAVSLEYEEIIEEEITIPEDGEMNILGRIKVAENWAAINAIAQEINASKIVQEVTNANASFRQSENYITALSENITAILSNNEYDTKTQLSKVRAILHDKAYIKAKNNSVLEQSVEEIIMTLVDKAKYEVEYKTQELDEKILHAFKTKGSEQAENLRLATIIEQRSKTLIELTALDLEIKGLATACMNTINDTVENVISTSATSTESPLLDSQMKARYGDIVPANIIIVLDNLFRTGKESTEAFGEMSESVNSTIRKLYQLLSLYQEESEVLGKTIRYLKANKVEDTVLANTIMKKTNRLFVNNGDFDSIAMTYIISKHNSRKNNNVMLLDLTGSDVLDMFGVKYSKYSYFMENDELDKKFLVVSRTNDAGVSIDTDEDCQRLSTRLLHYAKHYSMINIMCTPEQEAILSNFMSEVLSITYLVDCYPTTINTMAKCIESTKVNNTANRIVLINYISDSAAICNNLGVMDRLEVQLSSCKSIPEIRYCSLHNQDPYEVESILDDCIGVLKVC